MATAPTPTPSPSPDQPGICHRRDCHQPIVKRGPQGPPRLYCNNVCRQTEYRRRRQEQDPGHAPPPAPAPTGSPLQQAMTLIEQELPNLTRRQAGSAYGQNLLRAHHALTAASSQGPPET